MKRINHGGTEGTEKKSETGFVFSVFSVSPW